MDMSDDRRRAEDERAAPDLDAEPRDVIDDYMGHYVPDSEQTAGIRERILQLVRNDLYRGPSTKPRTDAGHEYSIASAAVRTIVRDAVDSVDGIRSRRRHRPRPGNRRAAAEVRLTVTMRADVRFVAAADLIRTAVSEALVRELGVPAHGSISKSRMPMSNDPHETPTPLEVRHEDPIVAPHPPESHPDTPLSAAAGSRTGRAHGRVRLRRGTRTRAVGRGRRDV
ncbi:hypothetical protein IOD13_15200 [Brevibacterium casei]|nr:hypothetical protein [Brevibacterium casei]